MHEKLVIFANAEELSLDLFVEKYSSLVTDTIMSKHRDIEDTDEGRAYVGYCLSHDIEPKIKILRSDASEKLSLWLANQVGYDYNALYETASKEITEDDAKNAGINIGDIEMYEYLYIARQQGWITSITNTITLYHGSPDPNFVPNPNYINDETDYGSGLYLTPYPELAKEWASASDKYRDAYIYTFKLNISNLVLFDFNQVNPLVWLAELCKHYMFRIDLENISIANSLIKQYDVYSTSTKDVLTGWRGDSAYFNIVNRILHGTIAVQQITDALHLGNFNDQYCIKTQKAYAALTKSDNYKCKINNMFYNTKYEQRMSEAYKQFENLKFNGTSLSDYIGD